MAFRSNASVKAMKFARSRLNRKAGEASKNNKPHTCAFTPDHLGFDNNEHNYWIFQAAIVDSGVFQCLY